MEKAKNNDVTMAEMEAKGAEITSAERKAPEDMPAEAAPTGETSEKQEG